MDLSLKKVERKVDLMDRVEQEGGWKVLRLLTWLVWVRGLKLLS